MLKPLRNLYKVHYLTSDRIKSWIRTCGRQILYHGWFGQIASSRCWLWHNHHCLDWYRLDRLVLFSVSRSQGIPKLSVETRLVLLRWLYSSFPIDFAVTFVAMCCHSVVFHISFEDRFLVFYISGWNPLFGLTSISFSTFCWNKVNTWFTVRR